LQILYLILFITIIYIMRTQLKYLRQNNILNKYIINKVKTNRITKNINIKKYKNIYFKLIKEIFVDKTQRKMIKYNKNTKQIYDEIDIDKINENNNYFINHDIKTNQIRNNKLIINDINNYDLNDECIYIYESDDELNDDELNDDELNDDELNDDELNDNRYIYESESEYETSDNIYKYDCMYKYNSINDEYKDDKYENEDEYNPCDIELNTNNLYEIIDEFYNDKKTIPTKLMKLNISSGYLFDLWIKTDKYDLKCCNNDCKKKCDPFNYFAFYATKKRIDYELSDIYLLCNSCCNRPYIKNERCINWINRNGKKLKSKCFCNKEITVFDHHKGHIIPKSKGGANIKENYYPQCMKCNLSIKDEFIIKSYYSQKIMPEALKKLTKQITKNFNKICDYNRIKIRKQINQNKKISKLVIMTDNYKQETYDKLHEIKQYYNIT
jgi:hypothetical protein